VGSESDFADEGMMMEGVPRGLMQRQGSRGHGGGMMGGLGGPGGRRGAPPFFEGMDGRPRSAPEMPLGAYPGMGGMGSPRMGMPGMVRMGGMGPRGMEGLGGMGPRGMEGMGGMPPGGMGGMSPSDLPPPGYTSVPSGPRFGGGMPGANPYAYPAQQSSPPSSTGSAQEQPTHRPTRRPPGEHERVPMGAYAKNDKSSKLTRARTEPSTADRLNRRQSGGKTVGPSGKEWLKGDDFLDACICTTGCTCREGHRVLYRSRDDPYGDDDTDNERTRYRSGEIRYILKKDLGRDCGDHSACKSAESEKEGNSKKSRKREAKEKKQQYEGLKDDILEAIDEKFDALKKEQKMKAPSVSSPRPPFAGLGAGLSPYAMGGPSMDPLIAQKIGMDMGGNPYAMGMPNMGNMPPGMPDPMTGRPMRPGHMPIGGIPGGMGFEDEMSVVDTEGMGPLGMGNPYLASGMKGKGMRPNFMSPRRQKRGGHPGLGAMNMDMDMDQMSLYGRSRGMGRRAPQNRRPRHPDLGSDDFDLGLRRPQTMNRRRESGDDRGGYDKMPGELVYQDRQSTR
jgi:hypothetical protein